MYPPPPLQIELAYIGATHIAQHSLRYIPPRVYGILIVFELFICVMTTTAGA